MSNSNPTPTIARSARIPVSGVAWRVRALVVLLAVMLSPIGTASAQDLSTVTDRMERLERTLLDLQRTVYGGATPPAASTGGDTNIAPTAMARVEVRLQQLEAQIRTLTGLVEEAQYRGNRLEQRLDTLQADTDYRLRTLEGTADPNAAGQGQSGQNQSGQAPASSGQTAATAPSSGTLGTLSGSDLAAGSSLGGSTLGTGAGSTAALPPPGSDPEALYDAAFDLLVRKDFAGAERAFSRFVEEHPQDPLAGNAQYWLGETFYVRERYEDAAVAFLDGFRTYPDSPKASDNLLKLGMALARAGKNQEACVTFAKVEADFPQAGPQIKRRLFLEKQRLQCG
jgi:tol-pal system protein YbgF